MTRLFVNDADLVGRLAAVAGSAEFCDSRGVVLGHFLPAAVAGNPSTVAQDEGPWSAEELQRRYREEDGRPLGDILKSLGAT
jgi:hypothetical protein